MHVEGSFRATRVILAGQAARFGPRLVGGCLILVLCAADLWAEECGAGCIHPEKTCLCVVDPQDATIGLTPLGSIERRLAEVGQTLEIGDELVSTDGRAVVELTCPGGSQVKLHGQFRAVIMPGEEGQDCALNLFSGAADVLTENPTQLESGEAVMGSKRTQYGMRVWRDADGANVECIVFDGEVRVHSRGARWGYDLTASRKALWRGGRRPERADPVSERDIGASAAIYARADVARLQARGVEVADPGALRRELLRTYAQVMAQPHEVQPRIELAALQTRVSNPKQALYHLGRAEMLEPAQTEEKAAIATTKWVAYKQSGEEENAKAEAEKVRTLDPAAYQTLMRTSVPVVVRPAPGSQTVEPEPRQPQPESRSEQSSQPVRPTLQGSQAVSPAVRLPAPPPIVVTAAPRPATVGVGEFTAILVTAATREGTPIPDARVTISAGGGTFRGTRHTQLSGATNARGEFQAHWTCKPCAPAYRISIEVSKAGFTTATAAVNVKIR
jgi:hypothetical protein